MSELTEQEIIRRESLRKIQELGINPYPAEEYLTTTTTSEIKKEFSEEKNNFQNVRIAGRIMSRRIMGKASFAEICFISSDSMTYPRAMFFYAVYSDSIQ